MRMRQNENRTSLSQQFFQKKMTSAMSEQNLSINQKLAVYGQHKAQQPHADNNALVVEDLFEESVGEKQ